MKLDLSVAKEYMRRAYPAVDPVWGKLVSAPSEEAGAWEEEAIFAETYITARKRDGSAVGYCVERELVGFGE